ncbi:Alpha/Beta hydrolase protein [Xylariaceae sp. FL1272]|nr:Alpha/Beta hydrolase protein [Xylariaceae sp. FL1272]
MSTENGTDNVSPAKDSHNTLSPSEKSVKAKHKTNDSRSRTELRVSASWWRHLQCLGMNLHFLAPPRPPNPDFTRRIPSTLSNQPGNIDIHFYLPGSYTRNIESRDWPIIVNYHGGGFTIGHATDDSRWARFVLEKSHAVMASVEYRLAPEYPFPTAVDDGTDALLYIIHHAAELRIDRNRIATSGFSAGGNIALTAPMRLHLHSGIVNVPEHRVVAVATWYPITDFTLSRDERRANSVKPEATMPPALTSLFDASYLFPPELDLADPCLSPNKASDELLQKGIPDNVFFFTCELDMLLREGELLAWRLQKAPVSKRIFYTMIPDVQHGWDKAPNPVKPPDKSEHFYKECCTRLGKVFNGHDPQAIFERPRRVPPPPSSQPGDGDS